MINFSQEIKGNDKGVEMSYTAEAHADWHLVNGWTSCPLDCYAVEAYWAEEAERAEAEARYEALSPEAKAQEDAELRAYIKACEEAKAEKARDEGKGFGWGA